MNLHANEYATEAARSDLSEAHKRLARFKEAVAKAGGRPPMGRNGRMSWNEERGWLDGGARPVRDLRPVSHSGRGRTLADLQARQRDVAREIRMSEVRGEENLLMGATALAWHWAKLFAAGGALSWGASTDERAGWELHRLGYVRPPRRVLERQLARMMR